MQVRPPVLATLALALVLTAHVLTTPVAKPVDDMSAVVAASMVCLACIDKKQQASVDLLFSDAWFLDDPDCRTGPTA